MLVSKLQISVSAIAAVVAIGFAEAFQLKDAAEYEVKRDLLEQGYPVYNSFRGRMHAGLMPAALTSDTTSALSSEDYSSYFFVLYRPDADGSTSGEQTPENFRDDTLIVWFNGGPGCSSMTGMMGEMGPVGTAKFRPGIPPGNPATVLDAPLVENPFAWTKKSAMLFVEQPGGTGFSSASSEWTGEEAEKRTEDDVASAFYAFLQNIYMVFGDELLQKKLYITGESYAGMYIPSVARGIHLRNKHVLAKDEGFRSPSLKIVNLRGLAIGNGWIDPLIQGPTTIDYAWWHGMIDLQTYRGLHAKWDQCVAQQIIDSSESPFHPFTVPDECGIVGAVMEASGGAFQYDVTTYDAYPSVLDTKGTINNFFNDPIVRESLNAPSMEEHPKWMACVPGSGRRRRLLESTHERELILLDNDKPMSVVPYISELLDDAKLNVLLYNGDLDLSCNSQGTELALESMQWSGKQGWMDTDTTKWHQWNVDSLAAGRTKRFNNLTFLVVYNSGHFVPINQARNALDMIGRLLDGKSMGDKELPVFAVHEEKQTQDTSTDKIQAPNWKPRHSFLPGLVCFLLGILTHYIISKRSNSRKKYSPSSSSSSFEATEATPLHSSGEA